MSEDSPVAPPSIAELRHARQQLKREHEHIVYWRRLLRARVDVAMSSILTPNELGYDAWGVLPQTPAQDIPSVEELIGVIQPEAWPQVELLDRCRELDERLAVYETTIVTEVNRITNLLIDSLSNDPRFSSDLT